MNCEIYNYPGLGILESENGTVAYTYGPSFTGQLMTSGQYFTNQWGALLSKDGIIMQNLGQPWKYLSKNPTGLSIKWFGDVSNLDSTYSNLSFCFNNSGLPVFGLQNNNYIDIFEPTSSGIITTSWIGNSPALLNSILINPPSNIPEYLYPLYQTGNLLCFYEKTGSYYYRINTGIWSSEYLLFTGLLNSNEFATRSRSDFIDQPTIIDRAPYRFIIANPNLSGNRMRVISSKNYINYAFDDFSIYQSGIYGGLGRTGNIGNGYGGWEHDSALCPSLGYSIGFDIFTYNSFSGYTTGLNQNNGFGNVSFYMPVFITGNIFTYKIDQYQYDDLSKYSTGSAIIFNQGNYVSGYASGLNQSQTYTMDKFEYDSFSGYLPGSIRLLRRGTFIECGRQIGLIFR